MRICTDKSGKLIEMQSHATEGTLIQNAINSGYKKDDVTERVITMLEWAAIVAAQPSPPVVKSKVDMLADALIEKGTITQADIDKKKLGEILTEPKPIAKKRR
jgi:hypothetical protein